MPAPGDKEAVENAAILLMSLGEQTAAAVLRHMGPKEVQRIGAAMAELEHITKDRVQAVLDEFVNQIREETGFGIGNQDYIRSVLTSALGEEKACSVIDRILLGGNAKGLESLKWMDAKGVAELIRLEHPQIIAIVLSYLDSDQAAAVLAEFPAKKRAEVLLRVATLEGVQPTAMQELNEILEHQLRGGGLQNSGIGGTKAAANILNFVDSGMESELIEQIKEMDNALGEQIEELMFVFDNLVDVDNRGIQTLLREISTDVLVLALKGAEDALKEKIFSCMSQRAAEMLKDDLEAKGPVRISDVETAQKEILTVARRLAEEGQITLGGTGGEQMI